SPETSILIQFLCSKDAQTILDCADPQQGTNTPRPQRLPTAAACASLLDFTIYNVQDPSRSRQTIIR
ncbi:hypothetical protein, partial [Azospirillum sp. TSH64]|uniref:hypothetical protein n=1 Tax=Azospirillum sp. TSH64 TaxID=652740 RepID=UPI001B3BE788